MNRAEVRNNTDPLTCGCAMPKPVILTDLGKENKKTKNSFAFPQLRQEGIGEGIVLEARTPGVLVWAVPLKTSSATNLG